MRWLVPALAFPVEGFPQVDGAYCKRPAPDRPDHQVCSSPWWMCSLGSTAHWFGAPRPRQPPVISTITSASISMTSILAMLAWASSHAGTMPRPRPAISTWTGRGCVVQEGEHADDLGVHVGQTSPQSRWTSEVCKPGGVTGICWAPAIHQARSPGPDTDGPARHQWPDSVLGHRWPLVSIRKSCGY